MPFPTDIEIAQQAKLRPIADVAAELDLTPDDSTSTENTKPRSRSRSRNALHEVGSSGDGDQSDSPMADFGSDTFTRGTLRFAWHLTTVVWYGIAVLVWWMARGSGPLAVAGVGDIVAATALVSAVVSFIGSRGRHPAWAVFLVVAMLIWYGTR